MTRLYWDIRIAWSLFALLRTAEHERLIDRVTWAVGALMQSAIRVRAGVGPDYAITARWSPIPAPTRDETQ